MLRDEKRSVTHTDPGLTLALKLVVVALKLPTASCASMPASADWCVMRGYEGQMGWGGAWMWPNCASVRTFVAAG